MADPVGVLGDIYVLYTFPVTMRTPDLSCP